MKDELFQFITKGKVDIVVRIKPIISLRTQNPIIKYPPQFIRAMVEMLPKQLHILVFEYSSSFIFLLSVHQHDIIDHLNDQHNIFVGYTFHFETLK
jgi:hypothetical protein